ncbi:MAG: molybdopterin-dependent oxidoreductase, partial [Eggerthellaceae bacterium]|nr:molybdopterin-dependent oxidoreductase [Eggerthellaceae bacterium]
MASEVLHEAQPKSSVGRRAFLMGSAAALGVAAATGFGCKPDEHLDPEPAPAPGPTPAPAPEEKEFVGSCRGNCFGGCKIKVKVREGKVVSTTMGEFPNKSYNRICQRGLSHLQRIYDPDRLKVPLRRAGQRGENKWEEITWDEAINEIATKWKAIMDTDGGSAIAIWPSAGGNFGAASTSAPQRLQAAIGMSSIGSVYDANLFAGGGFSKGTGVNEIIDLPNSKYVIIWGGNPSEAQPQHYHFIIEAQRNDAKVVTIDPNYTHMASHSDWWIPIRPGTDTAMVMAMMNIAIDNGWIDEKYIKIGTVGPFLVKATDGKFLRMSDLGQQVEGDPIVVRNADGSYVAMNDSTDPVIEGTYDANGIKVTCAFTLLKEKIKEWTPARAAELCDVSVETITKLTDEYTHNGPSTIITGLGPDHYYNGHQFYFTVTGLAGITGNLGKPGATCGMDWPVGGFSITTAPTMTRILGGSGPTIPGPKLYDAMVAGQLEGKPVNIKSLYIYSGNPIANQVDRQRLIKAFEMID